LYDINYIYEVEVDEDRILKVNTKKKLNDFVDEYKLDPMIIRWDDVSMKYDGIEFCPHLKAVSKEYWYGLLEIASGVVWNPDAIDIKYKTAIQKSTLRKSVGRKR